MPSNHLYPDPSDLYPCFLSGELDLDDTDAVSSLALGEAMLNVQGTTKPLALTALVHAYATSADRDSSRFMFGLLSEPAAAPLPAKYLLHLHQTELD